jgi:hypothetical protein
MHPKTWLPQAILVSDWPIFKNLLLKLLGQIYRMSNFYRGSSIDASYQVSYHLAKRLQGKSCFRN